MSDLIDRITKMENILDNLTLVVEKSDKAMDELAENLKDLETLKEYYQSQYLKDVTAESRGEVPQELKRGVLSEDTVYLLLSDIVELSEKMEQLSKKLRWF